MKTSRKFLRQQKTIMEKKIFPWLKLRSTSLPRAGWLKAIRGALGLSTTQLAKRMGVDQAHAYRLEQREVAGSVTLDSLKRAAEAMDCDFIYAIVPKKQFKNLDDILSRRAMSLAEKLHNHVEHSMKLEAQGSSTAKKSVRKLAAEVKEKMDSRLWSDLN
jgi:predicted DNA-binding mobile mystery protein A